MTELGYLADMPSAYIRSFRARIVALPPGGVVLDRTYFYPAGGGQPADLGTLQLGDTSMEVTDVTRSGASVFHRVRSSPVASRAFSVGAEVEGRIDWARRHQHMRLHTGQHLLSARTFQRTGLRTQKAVLRGVEATIDLAGELPEAAWEELAQDMERVTQQVHPVSIHHVARAIWNASAAAGRSGLVPIPAHVDPVRVVDIEGEDTCPCGGTHVRTMLEIGEVRMTPFTEPRSGSSRLGFTLVKPGATVPPE
ncbi:MAG: alanyl-tRNA editing protein [Thermoplasmata archaeon]|nr:alanyl-tRNA editing protein [Thermoplasmata archaeon]